jgi:hypothetical protein
MTFGWRSTAAVRLGVAVFYCFALALPAFAAQVTFTGNVNLDFTGSGVVTGADDSTGYDVGIIGGMTAPSGHDMKEIRLAYDHPTDTLFVGFYTFVIAGDVDNDGGEGTSGAALLGAGGIDLANFGFSETIMLILDMNSTGPDDIMAGIDQNNNTGGWNVTSYSGNAYTFGGTSYATSKGTLFYNTTASWPTGGPHFEISIKKFSTLPNATIANGRLTFRARAFAGAQSQDNGIGEDNLPYFTAEFRVPEPTALVLLLVGGAGLHLGTGRRRGGRRL